MATAPVPDTMRIGLVAPPVLPIPPRAYAGTERVVAALADGLVERGHEVTLFASGDSTTAARLVTTVPVSTWTTGGRLHDAAAYMRTAEIVARRATRLHLDLVHSHIEAFGLPLVRRLPMPVLTTLHLNPSLNGTARVLVAYPDAPLVAISGSQRRELPGGNWIATIHHGLRLDGMSWSPAAGRYLLLVGRAAPEKGVAEAIEIARQVQMPLRIVAKVREPDEIEYFGRVIRPALHDGLVTFLGELNSAARDAELAGAYATLMMGDWPEPFGLVSIESMAAGTPVIGRARGALPEIVRDAMDGFVVEDVPEAVAVVDRVRDLDRAAIRRAALARFSAHRMVGDYETAYRRAIGEQAPVPMSGRAIPVPPKVAGDARIGADLPLHSR